MPHHWPSEPPLVRWELDVLDRGCRVCGRKMHVCDHRRHPIYTLQGPRLLVNRLVHCVDGLQPEKGHETLYVVRELTLKRVWFAEALVSSSASEVRRLIVQARVWAERLGKPVAAWVSDKQDAFLTGIAAEFPGVPHHFCENHFLRDVAKPVLEQDRHAKVRTTCRQSKVTLPRYRRSRKHWSRCAAPAPYASSDSKSCATSCGPAMIWFSGRWARSWRVFR